MSISTKVTGAESIQWDLSDLYPGTRSTSFIDDKNKLESESASFAAHYRGKVASLSATELSEALQRYELIQDVAGRLGSFAYLTWSTDTLKPENGKLLQEMTEFGSKVNQNLIFF